MRLEGTSNTSTFKTMKNGRINLELGQRNHNLEMRVKYDGFNSWSDWQWLAADALVIYTHHI